MESTQEAGRKIREQETFYNDRYFSTVFVMLLMLLMGVALFWTNFLLLATHDPEPAYFEANQQGGIIAEVPLEQSNMDINALLNWVTEGMMNSNTFNFMNYQKTIDNSAIYFTKDGFESYNNAMNNQKIIDRIIQKKLVLKTTPTDAPQVLVEKAFAGRYMWKIKAPLLFKYQSVTTEDTDLMEVTLVVMRVPSTQSPNGVLILKYDLNKAPQSFVPTS